MATDGGPDGKQQRHAEREGTGRVWNGRGGPQRGVFVPRAEGQYAFSCSLVLTIPLLHWLSQEHWVLSRVAFSLEGIPSRNHWAGASEPCTSLGQRNLKEGGEWHLIISRGRLPGAGDLRAVWIDRLGREA